MFHVPVFFCRERGPVFPERDPLTGGRIPHL